MHPHGRLGYVYACIKLCFRYTMAQGNAHGTTLNSKDRIQNPMFCTIAISYTHPGEKTPKGNISKYQR